jgi:iron complex transport system ATP-binding protein
MKALLEIEGLTVRRGGPVVLRGLTWRVMPGEVWTILGPNGSGKTSLLSCLTGLLTPSSGVVRVLGERYGETDWIGLRRRIGMVSSSLRQRVDDDETALSVIGSGMSGQINYWGRLDAEEEAAARRMAGRLRCTGLLERRWEVLSQGERQRVLMARALVGDPALLILDEPCAGLDPAARERFLGLMGRMAGRGEPGLVLVTHHVEEIPAACTHVLALRGGRVAAAGPVGEVLRSGEMSRVFGCRAEVGGGPGRWWLRVVG